MHIAQINQYNNLKTYNSKNKSQTPSFQSKVSDIPVRVLDQVQNIIQRYNVFDTKDAFVAYSGGKDSFFLCQSLKSLDYNVHPIMIDIGYSANWSKAKNNLKKIGLDSLLLNEKSLTSISPENKVSLDNNFKKIINLSRDKNDKAKKNTICTSCYNSKILLLIEFAKQNGIKTVAFGHHATDAIASMLKSYYMYVDRWVKGSKDFNISKFSDLINSQRNLFGNGNNSAFKTLTDDILNLIKLQKVGTDEPVLRKIKGSDATISRPLFGVYEEDIIDQYKNTDIIFPQSECFAMGFRKQSQLTAREMIQYNLVNQCPTDKKDILLDLCQKTLNDDGTQIFDVRNNRSTILGADYKNTKSNSVKL